MREDGGVNPDEFAAAIDQGAARVTLVDGRIGLDKIFVGRNPEVRTPDGTHDSECHCLVELKRVADGEYPLGHADRGRIAPWCDRQPSGVDFQQGDIGPRIYADYGRLELSIVRQGYSDLGVGAPYHMVIRQDVAIT